MSARCNSSGRFVARDQATGSSIEVRDVTGLMAVAAETAAEQMVELVVQRVSRTAQRLLSTRNFGESGASRPGQPPSLRTGALRDSVPLAASTFRDGDEFVGITGSTVEYAVYLELGTEDMQPRPFLRPALDENADRIARIGADALAIQLKRRSMT